MTIIKSYLALAMPGSFQTMIPALQSIQGVEVHPASDGASAVLVTEADSPGADQVLFEQIQAVRTMQCLMMVYGADAQEAITC